MKKMKGLLSQEFEMKNLGKWNIVWVFKREGIVR
jgi:hypothetical protein